MGWFRRLVHRLKNRTEPAWVSPQFLALFVAFGIGMGAFALWAGTDASSAPGTDGGAGAGPHDESAEREFVGCDLEDAAAYPGLNLLSRLSLCVEDRWDAWAAAHADATILGREPVHEGGALTGYWVTFREAGA